MPPRECPMCASNMRHVTREATTLIPGSTQSRTTTVSEWVCPDCDYFEEVDGEEE